MKHILAGLAGLLAGAIATSAAAEDWSSQHHRDHQLVGRIWSAATGTLVTAADLENRIRSARYLLLGEIHPNPDHHRLQAWAIDAASNDSRKPAVIFEMIPNSMQGALDKHLRNNPGDAAGLGDAVKWNKSGWPDWAIYRPVAEAALRNGLPIYAGNLDRKTTRQVARFGASALTETQRRRFGIDDPLDQDTAAMLEQSLADSHCGLLPKQALAPMAVVQRSRDGAMASAMIDAAGDHGAAILIAGSGHIRRDWAVPAVIMRNKNDAAILSVAFMEVVPGSDKPEDYLPDIPDKTSVYDYVYFTPRSEIRDHCAELKKQFGNRKSKPTKD